MGKNRSNLMPGIVKWKWWVQNDLLLCSGEVVTNHKYTGEKRSLDSVYGSQSCSAECPLFWVAVQKTWGDKCLKDMLGHFEFPCYI